MARNTSILLGEYFEKFIDTEVSSGRYTSASEVVRTALRLLQTEEEMKKGLVTALKKGEGSKRIEKFDAKKHLAALHKKHL
jgi:antitoxin ParD1/3/4